MVLALENAVPPRSHTPLCLIQGVDGNRGEVVGSHVRVVCQEIAAVIFPRLVLEPADGGMAIGRRKSRGSFSGAMDNRDNPVFGRQTLHIVSASSVQKLPCNSLIWPSWVFCDSCYRLSPYRWARSHVARSARKRNSLPGTGFPCTPPDTGRRRQMSSSYCGHTLQAYVPL